jgi:putative tricarboxylic transport membrane protein
MGIARNGQALFAIFLLVLNAGYLAEALTLPTPFARGEPGPAFLPLILSLVLFVAAGRILVAELRGTGDRGEEGEPVGGPSVRPVILAVITGGFVWGFEPLGYWVATLLYTFAVAVLFEFEQTARPLRILAVAAAVAVAVTVVGWLFFVTLFDLFLPTGDW